jgi:GrpB-like predicted nucleotidyltransferase (UPF0157 family)
MDNIHFYTSEEISPKAQRLFKNEKHRILSLFPDVQVEHVGATSVPGALTVGDLDIQIRVKKSELGLVSKELKNVYHENHPELWNEHFSLFHKKDHPAMPMSIMVTVIDTPYDEFYKIRDMFRSDGALLERYNALKRRYEGKSELEYKVAKRDFFGPNGKNNLIQ